MARWIKLHRGGSEDPVWVNLDQAIMMSDYSDDSGAKITFGSNDTVAVVEDVAKILEAKE